MVMAYSVPFSGTRFTLGYLNHIEARHRQKHVEEKAPAAALVVPVRNPFDTYLSHTSKPKPEFSESWLISQFATLIWQAERAERAFYFPLDVEDRRAMLEACCEFARGKPALISSFVWQVVGASNLIAPKDEYVPTYMRRRLQFAFEWYRYRTENWLD